MKNKNKGFYQAPVLEIIELSEAVIMISGINGPFNGDDDSFASRSGWSEEV